MGLLGKLSQKPWITVLRLAMSAVFIAVIVMAAVKAETKGTFGYNGAHWVALGTLPVATTGEVMPGVFLCDSACFSDGPAAPLTFTIMANACRSAHQSLDA